MAGRGRSVADLLAGAGVLLVVGGFLVYAAVNTGRGATTGITLNAEFDNAGAIAPGADVRVAGVKVGNVTSLSIDPQSYRAVVTFNIRDDLKLSTDSSATVSSSGLLGGAYLTLGPGGADQMLANGGRVTITQSAVNLEDLLGKFIFNVGALADASQKQLQHEQQAHP